MTPENAPPNDDADAPAMRWTPTTASDATGASSRAAGPASATSASAPEAQEAASPLLASRADFHAALLAGLDEAHAASAPELWLVDRDFANWPLGDRAVVERLQAWITSRRQLRLLALDFRGLGERAPRWVAWRRPWAHAVSCFEIHPELAGEVPSLLLLPGRLAVRLFDPDRYRGSVERAPVELVRCRELVDALSQRASPAFPVTTLGL